MKTILAGIFIQAGALMIEAGAKKIVPELAKLIDIPELEKLTETNMSETIITTIKKSVEAK